MHSDTDIWACALARCPRKSSYICLMQDRDDPDVLGLEAEAYQQGSYFNAGQARAHGSVASSLTTT